MQKSPTTPLLYETIPILQQNDKGEDGIKATFSLIFA